MKIKALKTLRFNPTGFGKAETIIKGEEGDCPDDLAKGYIKAKLATKADAEKVEAPKKESKPETKPDDGSKGKEKETKPLASPETK